MSAPVCPQQKRCPCGPDIPVWPEGGRQERLPRFAHTKNVVCVWARASCLAKGRQTRMSAPVCPQQKRCPCGPDIPVWPKGGRPERLLRFAHSKNVVHVGQTFLSARG